MYVTRFYEAIAGIITLLYTAPLYSNVIWAGLIAAGVVYNHIYVIAALSIAVEAIGFHWFLKGISWGRTLLLSCVGNAASLVVGTLITMFAILPFEVFIGILIDLMVSPQAHIPDVIIPMFSVTAALSGMCLGSAGIELMAIYAIFRYPVKKVWAPILIANIASYALTLMYMYMLYTARTG